MEIESKAYQVPSDRDLVSDGARVAATVTGRDVQQRAQTSYMPEFNEEDNDVEFETIF
jgi:hypothetical protein